MVAAERIIPETFIPKSSRSSAKERFVPDRPKESECLSLGAIL